MVGTVAVLLRYPVKSMLGEEVASTDVDDRGLSHDRGFALVHDKTGKIASAKNPRLWRHLLKLSAEIVDGAVRITLPDGKTVWSTDADADARLSKELDKPVYLTSTPPPEATLDRAVPDEVLRDGIAAQVAVDLTRIGAASPEATFFDFAPIHLITTSTIDRIGELSPRGTVELERYRPNIVIDGPTEGFVENDWLGRDVRIGEELVLRVIVPTPRCAIPTLEHGDLPRDTYALRVPAQHNRVTPMEGLGPQPCAGAYAQVIQPGRIRVGDTVELA
jgi:hypothetical protein